MCHAFSSVSGLDFRFSLVNIKVEGQKSLHQNTCKNYIHIMINLYLIINIFLD